jgi:hypothetical protein
VEPAAAHAVLAYGPGDDTTPWYPSMRLFRQTDHCDWDGVFSRVTAALKQIAGNS